MESSRKMTIGSYFRKEKKLLILTSITGIIYNVGMTAGPWFEGQLAQYLYDILKGVRQAGDIVVLSLLYVLVIAIVQGARALKRLYVRKFANNVSRSMKETIFHHLVHESTAEVQKEDTGSVMTKAIADAEACAEGMRKFTTEIFDTGVVMIAYLVMLFVLDWRLTLLVIVFPPIAYIASAALKKRVAASSAASRTAMADLNSAAVDCVGNALTYRIYGEEENRSAAYERILTTYERKNVAAGIWQNSPQPVYLVISMIGVIPILYFGGRNVLGEGWIAWSIAAFSSFLSCFTKLATKSSHAAKLFNAVQKAQVSWDRIENYLTEEEKEETGGNNRTGVKAPAPAELVMDQVSCSYTNRAELDAASTGAAHGSTGSFTGLHNLNFRAEPGEIIGVTGRVASGKSTFGKLFLNEIPYEGEIRYGGRDIRQIPETVFAYMGHDPELFTGTVRENVTFKERGDSADNRERENETRLRKVLQEVQIDGEVTSDTMVGMEGSELSGGQQARIALARALYSRAPVLILDDPFSAVDADTEKKIYQALREQEKNRIILLISHRMAMFPTMDQIVYLEDGTMTAGTHAELMADEQYRALYMLQTRQCADRSRENQ